MARSQVIMAVLVVASVLTGVAGLSAVAAQSSETVDVTHDLRTDAHVAQFNETSEVTNTEGNTLVTVEDSDGFVRVKAENPNGYATHLVIDIPSAVAPPAELGDVASVAGADVEADWYVRQDLSSGDHHTRVELTLEGGENTTIAPSKPRLVTLSWTGQAQKEADGLMDRFKSNGLLEENTYTLEPPANASTMSVGLTNPDSEDEEIDDWHAMYRTSEDDSWRPVGTDVEDPVHKVENGDRVEFVFNDKDAEVEFTANPGFVDKASYSLKSYAAGAGVISDLVDAIPLTLTGAPGVFGGVAA